MPDSVLSARASVASANRTPLTAALLAADATAPEGFRVVDVRFYFLLFTNWMEDDVLRPGQDLDLTQVRRTLARLCAEGNATAGEGRRPRYRLTEGGVLELVDELAAPEVSRTFEEVLLLVSIGACYREVVSARVSTPAGVRRVLGRLDPARILRVERARLERALADLDARIQGGLEMERRVRASPGVPPQELAAQLEAERKSYQLQPVRGLREVVATLPSGVAAFELGAGLGFRVRALFTPLAAQLRARLGILDELEAQLAALG